MVVVEAELKITHLNSSFPNPPPLFELESIKKEEQSGLSNAHLETMRWKWKNGRRMALSVFELVRKKCSFWKGCGIVRLLKVFADTSPQLAIKGSLKELENSMKSMWWNRVGLKQLRWRTGQSRTIFPWLWEKRGMKREGRTEGKKRKKRREELKTLSEVGWCEQSLLGEFIR